VAVGRNARDDRAMIWNITINAVNPA